jgi:hypothetical protein
MSFGFANCAAVCPVTLGDARRGAAEPRQAADAVQVVFVTVDPERDDAARLKAYLAPSTELRRRDRHARRARGDARGLRRHGDEAGHRQTATSWTIRRRSG